MLMGGGIIASAVVPLVMAPDCEPSAQQDGGCTSNTSSRTGSSSSSRIGHGGSTAAGLAAGAAAGATAATVARGGFGSTGAARASSGG